VEPTRELIDAIYRERVLRARRTPPEQKILSGATLFDEACRRMEAGIRMLHPEADEEAVRAMFRRRMEIARRLDPPR
jgi:hypothetical protein